jgi:hypothetical protein
VFQAIVAPTSEMLDEAIDVIMSNGEPLFRPDVAHADDMTMTV